MVAPAILPCHTRRIEENTVKRAGAPLTLGGLRCSFKQRKFVPGAYNAPGMGSRGTAPWWGAGAKPLPAGGPLRKIPPSSWQENTGCVWK